jgi:molybdopterin converting factor subunit 1
MVVTAMKVRVLYFGIVRDRLAIDGESVEVEEGTTVGDLLRGLSVRHGFDELGSGVLRVALNRDYVGEGTRVSDGDEVAIIPPVSGGCGGGGV